MSIKASLRTAVAKGKKKRHNTSPQSNTTDSSLRCVAVVVVVRLSSSFKPGRWTPALNFSLSEPPKVFFFFFVFYFFAPPQPVGAWLANGRAGRELYLR